MIHFLLGVSAYVSRWLLFGWLSRKLQDTPWKMNGWNLQNHPFRKENDLNQTSMIIWVVVSNISCMYCMFTPNLDEDESTHFDEDIFFHMGW